MGEIRLYELMDFVVWSYVTEVHISGMEGSPRQGQFF